MRDERGTEGREALSVVGGGDSGVGESEEGASSDRRVGRFEMGGGGGDDLKRDWMLSMTSRASPHCAAATKPLATEAISTTAASSRTA